jgi:hypothetical protein
MGIRTVCFVLAVVTTGPVRWVLVAAALVLPYIAVVMANASERRSESRPANFMAHDHPAIEPGERHDPPAPPTS